MSNNDVTLVREEMQFEREFLQMRNNWARGRSGAGLSLDAIGLLSQLLSHRPGYTINYHSLGLENRCGREKIARIVGELKKAGFLRIEKRRDRRGRMSGAIWVLQDPGIVRLQQLDGFDFPEVPDTRTPENRTTGNRTTENPTAVPYIENDLLKEDNYPGSQSDPGTRARDQEERSAPDLSRLTPCPRHSILPCSYAAGQAECIDCGLTPEQLIVHLAKEALAATTGDDDDAAKSAEAVTASA